MKDLPDMYKEIFAEPKPIKCPSIEGLEEVRKIMNKLHKVEPSDKFIKDIESTKKTRIEYAEDRYTGTLYPMEVEVDEDEECPVIKEARK